MPNLEDYYGVNVDEEFARYLVSPELQEWLDSNYPGDHPSISFAALNNDFRSEWDWRNPLGNIEHVLVQSVIWGDVAAGTAPDGTMENVEGKLRFVVREGMDSVEAETLLHLVQPGDFPWQGAGTYRGFTGGVSGRTKREDWQIFCHLIDYLIDLMNQVAEQAHKACAVLRVQPNCPKGLKYMNVGAFKQGFNPLMDLREYLGESAEAQHAVEVLVDKLQLETFAVLYFMDYTDHLDHHPLLTDEDRAFLKQRFESVTFAFAA